MKLKQAQLIRWCKKRGSMDLEIVVSRQYNSVLDENGQELNSLCNSVVKYCVRKKGSLKNIKCFPGFEQAKKYLAEIKVGYQNNPA